MDGQEKQKTVIEDLVLDLQAQLKIIKNECERRQNVYNWGSSEWKSKRKAHTYAEDTDLLRDAGKKLHEVIEELEILTPITKL